MQKTLQSALCLAALFGLAVVAGRTSAADDLLPRIDERFAAADSAEVPSFQKHVVPLFGQLGCNGRACHGSFQGQGGFRLSLFGYDFAADHKALFDKESPRVDTEQVEESLILAKPTDAEIHEGGQRYKLGSWEHRVILNWIQAGAELSEIQELERLEVEPREIVFQSQGEQVALQAVAVWSDGTREDVTPLCRFKSNDDQVAKINVAGRVTANGGGDTHLIVSYDRAVVSIPVLRPVSDQAGENYPEVPTPTRVDELVVSKLRKLGVVPSELAADAEFLRRVSLDITGTLPTAVEVEAFLSDAGSGKRARKVDELLESPAYAAWWTTKLCDWTGNNYDQLANANPSRTASDEWYQWINKRISENTPYDKLVEGIVTSASLAEGESYLDYSKRMSSLYHDDAEETYADLDNMTHYWARRDFREPEARAIGFAYAFMGIRIQCAQCHKHPFDQWSKEDFHLFKNYFSGVVSNARMNDVDSRKQYTEMIDQLGLKGKRGGQLRREFGKLLKQNKTVPFPVVYVGNPRASREYKEFPTNTARLLGGDTHEIKKLDDPRRLVMDWLRNEDNRFFATAFVNRVWASYFNVGIVNPPDDNSLANPPSNKPLLDYLAAGFIENDFDMKWVHRTIANSRTYQLTWRTNATNEGDERNFSHSVPRRLPAEVAYDAVQLATAAKERVDCSLTEMDGRAIALPGAGARYNRGDRDQIYALTVFGRSTRESNCDCDRSSEASLLQTVYLQNDQSVLNLIDIKSGGWLDEVAAEIRPQPAAAPQAERRRASLRKQLAAANKKLKSLRERDADAAVKKGEQRIAALRKQLRTLEAEIAESAPAQPQVELDLESYVQQAYLRTLSRRPDERELARSVKYLEEAGDKLDGIQDLLWALLNTKEFIVNH